MTTDPFLLLLQLLSAKHIEIHAYLVAPSCSLLRFLVEHSLGILEGEVCITLAGIYLSSINPGALGGLTFLL